MRSAAARARRRRPVEQQEVLGQARLATRSPAHRPCAGKSRRPRGLVTERVVLGGDTATGRPEVRGVERADTRVRPARQVGDPLRVEAADRVRVKPLPARILAHRHLRRAEVGGRVRQPLDVRQRSGCASSRRRQTTAARVPPPLSPALARARPSAASSGPDDDRLSAEQSHGADPRHDSSVAIAIVPF
jgi:hypothetical protein